MKTNSLSLQRLLRRVVAAIIAIVTLTLSFQAPGLNSSSCGHRGFNYPPVYDTSHCPASCSIISQSPAERDCGLPANQACQYCQVLSDSATHCYVPSTRTVTPVDCVLGYCFSNGNTPTSTPNTVQVPCLEGWDCETCGS